MSAATKREFVRAPERLLRGLLAVSAGYCPKASGQLRLSRTRLQAAWLYCVSGGGWCETDGGLATVRKGDLLVLPPGAAPACGAHACNPWSVYWACGQGELTRDYLRELGVGNRPAVLHVGEEPQLVRLFNEVFQCLRRGTAFSHLLSASHALAYLLALVIEKPRQAATEDSDTVWRIAQAIIYMSEHLDEPLRVSSLARLASLSPAYFGALFKGQTGCAPRDYLHLLRIHRACQLLRSTPLSVKQIATRTGYQDQFHFSRQFKAFQGLSPSQYRQAAESR